jgi:lipopolysaccharide transport system ATP-binding protein
VEFSELGEHIDRPYKGYSSGMQGRLSFSVSIFQRPDILLLDEVFATGDASFVEKSRQMMLSQLDTTPITIFVSHTSDLVRKICNRCIWMHQGVVREDGDPATVLRNYESFA